MKPSGVVHSPLLILLRRPLQTDLVPAFIKDGAIAIKFGVRTMPRESGLSVGKNSRVAVICDNISRTAAGVAREPDDFSGRRVRTLAVTTVGLEGLDPAGVGQEVVRDLPS